GRPPGGCGASPARCRRQRLHRRYKVRGRLIRKEGIAVKMAPGANRAGPDRLTWSGWDIFLLSCEPEAREDRAGCFLECGVSTPLSLPHLGALQKGPLFPARLGLFPFLDRGGESGVGSSVLVSFFSPAVSAKGLLA